MTARHSIERLADEAPVCAPDSWPVRRPPSVAYKAARAELEAQARKSTRAMIKELARDYALEPRQLDRLAEGLFSLSTSDRVTSLKAAQAIDVMRKHRWFGFGGEIPALNLRAAMLYSRLARAKAGRTI